MRTSRLSLVVLALAFPLAGSAVAAPKKKAGKPAVAAPMASAAEIDKLKGDFKWGMSPDEVMTKMIQKVEASFEERLNKTATDPARQDKVRKEMLVETEKVKKHSLVKFEGQKSGYDVSIIDQEFFHRTGESMLVAKEDNGSRYFFFANDRLYKMFVAFDKDVLQGKGFKEFGQLMQGRFGKAREIYVDERSKAGVTRKLDHYIWNTKGGDVLRLVDRSAFYDVYCLVIFDGNVAAQQAEAGKAHKQAVKSDALVDAVIGKPINNRDENDNVIDRITGREVRRPGDDMGQGGDIKVPMPTTPTRAPTPSEVNRSPAMTGEDGAEGSSGSSGAKSKSKSSKTKEKEKPGAGLEL
jgi:hypothetical protein